MTTATVRTIPESSSSISHKEALEAAQALIDFYFGNAILKVKVCIPAEESDTDVLLCNYIKQQQELVDALAADTSRAEDAQKWECEKAELLDALDSFCSVIAFAPSSIQGAIEQGLKTAYERAVALLVKHGRAI